MAAWGRGDVAALGAPGSASDGGWVPDSRNHSERGSGDNAQQIKTKVSCDGLCPTPARA